MALRLAFAGFRHGHILELYAQAAANPQVEIVAAAEEHAPTREDLARGGKVRPTHESYERLFADVAFDALAVGDYFAARGPLALRALRAGRHVISDKPLCVSLSELDAIAAAAGAGGLRVGCQFSIRFTGVVRSLRAALAAGRIGQVVTITFLAQHPLMWGSRPGWYFEPGKHGGTINDIAIHATDMIPWLTGRRIAQVVAGRGWNARVPQAPAFQDCGQVMWQLDNGGGVLGDVSYLEPDSFAYKLPSYWRMTFHGTEGVAETSCTSDHVALYLAGSKTVERLAPLPVEGDPLQDFLDDIAGRRREGMICTDDVLRASRIALLSQRAADEGLRDLDCR